MKLDDQSFLFPRKNLINFLSTYKKHVQNKHNQI